MENVALFIGLFAFGSFIVYINIRAKRNSTTTTTLKPKKNYEDCTINVADYQFKGLL